MSTEHGACAAYDLRMFFGLVVKPLADVEPAPPERSDCGMVGRYEHVWIASRRADRAGR